MHGFHFNKTDAKLVLLIMLSGKYSAEYRFKVSLHWGRLLNNLTHDVLEGDTGQGKCALSSTVVYVLHIMYSVESRVKGNVHWVSTVE